MIKGQQEICEQSIFSMALTLPGIPNFKIFSHTFKGTLNHTNKLCTPFLIPPQDLLLIIHFSIGRYWNVYNYTAIFLFYQLKNDWLLCLYYTVTLYNNFTASFPAIPSGICLYYLFLCSNAFLHSCY